MNTPKSIYVVTARPIGGKGAEIKATFTNKRKAERWARLFAGTVRVEVTR